jgi:hypothetical protein
VASAAEDATRGGRLIHFSGNAFELSRWRGGRCAYGQPEGAVPPGNCACLSVAMRCSIDPLPYVSPACNRQIPAGPWYESTETLFKIHIVTRSPQAPAAYFKRIFIRYWGLREAI